MGQVVHVLSDQMFAEPTIGGIPAGRTVTYGNRPAPRLFPRRGCMGNNRGATVGKQLPLRHSCIPVPRCRTKNRRLIEETCAMMDGANRPELIGDLREVVQIERRLGACFIRIEILFLLFEQNWKECGCHTADISSACGC